MKYALRIRLVCVDTKKTSKMMIAGLLVMLIQIEIDNVLHVLIGLEQEYRSYG